VREPIRDALRECNQASFLENEAAIGAIEGSAIWMEGYWVAYGDMVLYAIEQENC
jgi:hypothetical protein